MQVARQSAVSTPAEFADNISHEALGIAKKHQRFVQIVERVFDSRETGGHAALDDHHRARFVHVEDGHSVNRAAGIAASGGVGYIVGADNQGDVGLLKVAIDFVHVEQLIVR